MARVLVAGGGIGGLTAAAALAGAGVEVRVVEAKPDNAAVGVGLNQPANALRVLRRLGALDACLAEGWQFDRSRFCDADGRLIVEVPSRFGGDGIPANNAMPRPALHRILTDTAVRAGAELRLGVAVTGFQEHGDTVTAACSDGGIEDWDLLLAFDGIRSTVRAALFGPGAVPVHAGFGVWRVTVPRPPSVTCTEMYQGIRTKAGFIPLSREEMYLLAVVAEPADVRYAVADMPDLLAERLEEFGGLVGAVRDALPREGIVYSPLEEVLLDQSWSVGRVAIAGDAAHASTPHLTQGAAMAMEDGWVLSRLLGAEAPLPAILDAWTARRLPRVRLVQDVSRRILDSEMRVTSEDMPGRLAAMPAEVPPRLWSVQEYLNQPA